MSESQSIHSPLLSDQEDLFRKLAPSHQGKPKASPFNLLLKKKIDKQLQNKLKQSQKLKKNQQRSRSRQRKNKDHRLQYEYKNDQIIVISDDNQSEQLQNFNKFRALQRSIHHPIDCYQQDEGLNYRQRQRIDRILDRGMRQFREGKLRDHLSFQVFNTIQAYFK